MYTMALIADEPPMTCDIMQEQADPRGEDRK